MREGRDARIASARQSLDGRRTSSRGDASGGGAEGSARPSPAPRRPSRSGEVREKAYPSNPPCMWTGWMCGYLGTVGGARVYARYVRAVGGCACVHVRAICWLCGCVWGRRGGRCVSDRHI
eukprot:185873-Chlamydomonas_euryale.AAC.4